ncbi:kinase-like domain-containing protein [Tanacetum coccineum]
MATVLTYGQNEGGQRWCMVSRVGSSSGDYLHAATPRQQYHITIICLTSATVYASYGGNETDYLALLSFKSKVSHGLEGSLSPHVGNLSFLREFSLWNNSFQGTIPHELGHLSRLRRLHLGINKFSGVIPANLSGCSPCRVLPLVLNN